jgi:predicted exporter
MVAVSLFLWRVYRSLRFVLLTLLPLGSGALAGMAAVAVYSGNLNGIVLGFGSALIGFANDYPVHLFTHLNAGEPVAASIRRVWPTIRLGVLATVAGFGAMLFSGFPGLVELGVFSITGLLAAGLVCRWVMPAFLSGALNLPHWPGVFALLDRGRQAGLRVLLPLGLAVLAGVNAWLATPVWDDDIAHLSPLPESSQRFDQELRAELRAPELNRIALIIGPTAEDVLQRTEALSGSLDEMVGSGALAGYDLAARYLPSAARQLERRAVLPDPVQLRRDLNAAARGLPFKPGSFEPFVAAVAAARGQPPLQPADLRGTVLGLALEPLLFGFEKQWVGLVTLGESTAPDRLAEVVANAGGRLVDLRMESTRLITRYRQETLTLLSLGAVVIVLLLRAGLGTWSAAVRVVLPMGLALVFTGTVIRVVSSGLSLFHLVSLLLVMGLAMDYGLFFNRPPADREDHRRTQFSLLVCTMTTLLPFGLLALSQTPVLRAIGLTVSVGAASAFVLAAWLAKPGGVPRGSPERPDSR